MTREELIALLSGPFGKRYAEQTASRLGGAEDFATLYDVATCTHETLPADVRHKVLFRSAWVLERLFLEDPERMRPFAARFCRTDFPACTDSSARRHFTKIMALLLEGYAPDAASLCRIADSAAEWALDPAAKVAVKVGAVEVLRRCRDRVPWVAQAWEDLLEGLSHDASPGIACRMRRSWRT